MPAGEVVQRCKFGNREAATMALVNTGFECPEPEIRMPLPLAGRPGFSPEGARSERCAAVGGVKQPRPLRQRSFACSASTGLS
jgi:hypothetical protein